MSRSSAAIAFVVSVVAFSIIAAGCGSSPKNQVAQLGSTTTTTTGGASSSAGSPLSQSRSYAHCMRSHGVADFPDPESSGEIPKNEVVAARQQNPAQFDSANSACMHFLPSGGGNGETAAEIAQDWRKFRQFALCMRHDGVPNWPDPTNRSATDHRPAFRITAVGLDGNSAQLRAKAQHCGSQVHMLGLPAAA